MKNEYVVKLSYLDFNKTRNSMILYNCDKKYYFTFKEITKIYNDRKLLVEFMENYFKTTGIKGKFQYVEKWNNTKIKGIAFKSIK